MKICNFKNVYIKDAATVVGKLEGEGPLGSLFDMCESDSYFGKGSWEEAEAEMCGRAVGILLGKTGTDDSNVELMLGGDLLNQCTATGFTAADFPIPYLGLYGACSTAAEGMLIGGAFVSGGFADNAITLASSHFCSSERQFRYPLEYGSLRTPTTQNTVTGAGAFMLTNEKCDIRLSRALAGRVNINGITDANNMGAAMATAAVDTVLRYFDETGESAADYDIISTGDLGMEGYEIACELFSRCGFDPCGRLTDCGMLMYDYEKQDVNSGASGCGCAACVCGSLYLNKLKCGEAKRVLLIGTGALLSPKTVLQKLPIPAVAHLVCLERC